MLDSTGRKTLLYIATILIVASIIIETLLFFLARTAGKHSIGILASIIIKTIAVIVLIILIWDEHTRTDGTVGTPTT